MRKKSKGVQTTLHPDFYKRIEEERKKFMAKNKLDRLTTVAFTGMLINKRMFGIKNEKSKKRRR